MMLGKEFYTADNVVRIARNLLGKHLFTNIAGVKTGGMIVETEAYSWKERGCHAFNGKMTSRNKVMFEEGGAAYVYLCYGMHHLFNVVTNIQGVADAVLIRAIEPLYGISVMESRRGISTKSNRLTSGPAKLTKALGIDRSMNGKLLWNDEVWIEKRGENLSQSAILASKRIGIDYAGEDAHLLWRFSIKENQWVSRIR
jgi:DNA-3-methyladenine glycosylase